MALMKAAAKLWFKMAVTLHLHSTGGNTLKGTIRIFLSYILPDIAALILSFHLFKDVSTLLQLMGSEGACGRREKTKGRHGQTHRVPDLYNKIWFDLIMGVTLCSCWEQPFVVHHKWHKCLLQELFQRRFYADRWRNYWLEGVTDWSAQRDNGHLCVI